MINPRSIAWPPVRLLPLAALGLSVLLAGCAAPQRHTTVQTYPAPGYQTAPYPAVPVYLEAGRVTQVEVIRTEQRGSTGAGAVAGGVVGGVVGNQIGRGVGRDLATVAGAIGGAVLGNHLERERVDVHETYRVMVRLDNGSMRAFDYPGPPHVRVGDRVRIENQQLFRY